MHEKKLETQLIHTGNGQFQKRINKSLTVPETLPVYLTSAYALEDVSALDEIQANKADGYLYSREAAPNADAVAEIIADADKGEQALVFASGMAAITTTVLAFVQTGDHIIAASVLYGGVYNFLANELARFGVEVSFVDMINENITPHIKPNTKLVYTETISNPLMAVPDIGRISETAHAHGLLVLLDNTFATPVIAKPLLLGADIVLYSATKYLGGHSDLVAGAVVAGRELISQIKRLQILYGCILSPHDCWLLARSLRTLGLRMKKHSENALAVAQFLEAHPKIEKVFYPGLVSSPSYERAQRQFSQGYSGGMLSVNLKGGEKAALALVKALAMIPFVPSLAGTSTTVSYPVKTSHRLYSQEERKKLGITDGLLRFSVGLEDSGDIIKEIGTALDEGAKP
ncbi:MAG TPA: aminotransferase class I/II-fold pyridoxal phosphate-dependent enzyme [Desulfitobacteriaceae bacterium]|nr:aminotransferase class I/II-fold pyridoxal phosphate-dependent enzyme [Desulfitobacteriaceae bacterium]